MKSLWDSFHSHGNLLEQSMRKVIATSRQGGTLSGAMASSYAQAQPKSTAFRLFQPLRLPQPTNPSYFFRPLSVLLGMVILFRKRQTRLTGRFAVTFPSNRSDLQYSS